MRREVGHKTNECMELPISTSLCRLKEVERGAEAQSRGSTPFDDGKQKLSKNRVLYLEEAGCSIFAASFGRFLSCYRQNVSCFSLLR